MKFEVNKIKQELEVSEFSLFKEIAGMLFGIRDMCWDILLNEG